MQMDSNISINKKYLSLIELDTDENIICMIRKHPIGLVGVIGGGLFIALAVFVATYYSGIYISGQEEFDTQLPIGTIIAVIGAVVSVIVLFFTYVAAYIYRNNVIIVTSEKIAQILYRNLIDRKISQLSLGDIQDVTVDQEGIPARIFKYGTLVIETAGEQDNYNFTYTPYPYDCAEELVGAREASIRAYGN